MSSQLSHILNDNPDLRDHTLLEEALLPYKGRKYGWLTIKREGSIVLSHALLESLHLRSGSIRSSDIAFTMGAFGPLVERAKQFEGDIPCF